MENITMLCDGKCGKVTQIIEAKSSFYSFSCLTHKVALKPIEIGEFNVLFSQCYNTTRNVDIIGLLKVTLNVYAPINKLLK